MVGRELVRFGCPRLSNPRSSCHVTSEELLGLRSWLDWSREPRPPWPEAGAGEYQAGEILDHIKVLASDEFEGRGPGTPGEEKTIAYLTDQFQKMGLKPGNPDGTFSRRVPLVGFQAKQVSGSFQAGGHTIGLTFPNDFVAVSRRLAQEVKVENSDVVFVGYGVVAPEYGWDDYKGMDVRGKTLIMLVNDPAVPDPKDPAKLDPAFFKGRAMTYYGRWTYKYEIASEKGAAAAILVHETGPAGYPFEVVKGSWSRENFDIAQPQTGQTPNRVAIEGWITYDKAKELFQASGRDLDALKKAATRRDFRPVPLKCQAQFAITNTLREVQSHNVVAKLEGSDPTLKNETVIYTAHWDHLGRDPALKGDQIYNGAADNASGVACVLEIARASQVQAGPQTIDPVPGRDRRGKGIARCQVLRDASALSAGSDAGQHQYRRDQPLGADQGHHQHRHG